VVNSSKPVESRLRAQVAAGRLEFDASQLQAAAKLDRLSAALRRSNGSTGARMRERLRLWAPPPPADARRGLYLWGGVGRGKTMLMDCFYESLRFPRRERTHFYRFMRGVHAELRGVQPREQPLDAVAERLAGKARVICLDEFFVADIADAMILAGLFEGLFRRGVILVATSNSPPEDLYRDGLQRQRFLPAIELIRRHVDVLHLDGGVDYRLRQLELAPIYLDSSFEQTPELLRRRFAALAGGDGSGPSILSIEGREIAARATGPGLAWFDFAELCQGPRSQVDYIEIARMFDTVFVSNIPQFSRADEDAARRFVMLIDEFYDRGVKLVASAAAPPAQLYHGERLEFDFQRAASRLIEMQTEGYLAGGHRVDPAVSVHGAS
jgi:cell division protein ZapE